VGSISESGPGKIRGPGRGSGWLVRINAFLKAATRTVLRIVALAGATRSFRQPISRSRAHLEDGRIGYGQASASSTEVQNAQEEAGPPRPSI